MGSALPGSLCLGVGVDRRMVTAGSGDRVIGDCETGTNIPMMVTESAGWTQMIHIYQGPLSRSGAVTGMTVPRVTGVSDCWQSEPSSRVGSKHGPRLPRPAAG